MPVVRARDKNANITLGLVRALSVFSKTVQDKNFQEFLRNFQDKIYFLV